MNGHLEFIDPRNAVGEDFTTVLRLRPSPGAMVLFPKEAGIRVPWDDDLRLLDVKKILATVEEVPLDETH